MADKLSRKQQIQSIPDYLNGVEHKAEDTKYVANEGDDARQEAIDDERNMVKDESLKHGHTKTAFERVPDNMDHPNYQRVYSAKE